MLNLSISKKYDFTSVDFSTNQSSVFLEGTFSGHQSGVHLTYEHYLLDKFQIERLVGQGTVSSVSVASGTWALGPLDLEIGLNRVKLNLTDTTTLESSTASCSITYISEKELGIQVDPPTGVRTEQFTDKVVVKWLNNSSVSYLEKSITFQSSPVTEPSTSVGSGILYSVSGGKHTPAYEYFNSNQVRASLVDRKFYNKKLIPVGNAVSTRVWDLGWTPVDGSGLNRPTNDFSKIQISGTSSSGATISGSYIIFPSALGTGSEIFATYFYNEPTYDSYTVKVEEPGLSTYGRYSVSNQSGKVFSHAQLNSDLTSVASISWSPSVLWVSGISDLVSKFAPPERVTLSFINETDYTVSSDKGLAGTKGTGVTGRTFHTPTISFTIADTGLYASGDTVVFDVISSPKMTVGTDFVYGIPGIKFQVLNTAGCAKEDTAVIKVYSYEPPVSTIPKKVSGQEVVLSDSGSVNLDTLQLTSTHESPFDRVVYIRDVDYVVVNSEDINLPTLLYRTSISSIPENTEIYVNFQVTQSESSIKGYNIYASTEPAGGLGGYSQLNDKIINVPTSRREVVTSQSSSQSVVNGTRVTTLTEKLISLNEFSYTIGREILADLPQRVNSDLTTYFVVTAVATDTKKRKEIESVFSTELVAKPLEVTSQIQEFSPRTFDEIVSDYIKNALVSQPLLDVKPTSVTRDIHIDPVANEIEKSYLMLDFLNKSQSFLTLLAIDDPDNTGSSVLDTEYKSSLQVVFGLDSLEEVQALVDSQFDKLASNVNVSRNPAEQSRGVVTLYSVNLPSSSLTVTPNTVFTANLDSGAVNFKSLSSIVIDPEEFSSYLNRETGRYEIPIPVIAEKSGTSGNVDAGSVSLTNITNFLVTNLTPMVYGSDQESNRSLAERSLNALMGVDFGTIGGYIKEVISHPGVIKVASQGAGDRFMVRDYDFFRKSNLGGKVDLYIQGNRPLTYQEEFGINFIRVEDERVTDFEPGSLTFELDYKVENLEKVVVLRTGSRQEYALEGALLTGRKIILSPTNLKNTKIGLYSGDVILVTYYYASDFSYQLKHSPVLSIESVDRPTGRLGNENYRLDLSEDILRKGSSSQSPSSVRLIESSGVNFSAGVFEETATLNGTVPYPLLQYSIDLSKLIVSGTSGVYTLGRDFDIIDKGSNSTKTTIARKIGTRIADGESVSISYVASETFIIRYTVDNLIESIQTDLEKKEYATADVLVKRANVVPIDISAEVLINRGTSQSEVDLKIRTALGNHFSNLRLGDSVYQSDIIRIIDSVDGVYAVTTPIVKLSRAYNSYVVGDEIKLTGPRREGSSLVYRFDNTLSFDTINGGGILDLYTIRPVGMYINSRYFKGVSSLNEVFSLKNCCYITKSYIYISSLSESDLAEISKSDSKIIANYFSYEDKGVYDVKINAFEYPNLNNALFSYRNRQ